MEIAFQGEKGAYSHLACRKALPQALAIPCKSFEEVFARVETGVLGLVPVENSLAGSIGEVYDLLLKKDVKIIGETYLKVEHCLIAHPNSKFSMIDTVYSHPQALAQCSDFLRKHSLKAVPEYDTAGSVRIVKQHARLNEAAIASELAAEVYGMKVLRRNIESRRTNLTRFFIISPLSFEENIFSQAKRYKTSVVFELADKPGALYYCLKSFAENNINLTKLESRPNLEKAFSYMFYLDIEGKPSDRDVSHAISEFAAHVKRYKILGFYPSQGFDE